jgi:hypothetical protein
MTPTARALAKFHTQAEIEDFQRAVLQARYARAAVNIHVAMTQSADGTSTQSVQLSTVSQQDDFLADCEAAIAYLQNQNATGTSFVDFSKRRLRI